MDSRDFVDLSGYSLRRYNVAGRTAGSLVYEAGEVDSGVRTHFPAYAKGFLYFRRADIDEPEVLGVLRFRTVDSDSSLFVSGKDLTHPTGGYWNVHLLNLLPSIHAQPLVDALVEQGLVSEGLRQRWKGKSIYSNASRIRLVHALGQPYRVRMEEKNHSFTAVGECSLESSFIQRLTTDTRSRVRGQVIYRGTLSTCFEQSRLPEHDGRRVLVMRVLEIVEPVFCSIPGYDGHLPAPQVGQLMRTAGSKLWSCDIDKPTRVGRALAHLWPKTS